MPDPASGLQALLAPFALDGRVALVTGALVGATANRRATAARYSLDEVGTRERLNAEIGEHNEDLRVRLGLTETEALDAEYPSP